MKNLIRFAVPRTAYTPEQALISLEPISERAHHCSGISQGPGKETSMARMSLQFITYTLLSHDTTHPSTRHFA
jgi:hypothetical protein